MSRFLNLVAFVALLCTNTSAQDALNDETSLVQVNRNLAAPAPAGPAPISGMVADLVTQIGVRNVQVNAKHMAVVAAYKEWSDAKRTMPAHADADYLTATLTLTTLKQDLADKTAGLRAEQHSLNLVYDQLKIDGRIKTDLSYSDTLKVAQDAAALAQQGLYGGARAACTNVRSSTAFVALAGHAHGACAACASCNQHAAALCPKEPVVTAVGAAAVTAREALAAGNSGITAADNAIAAAITTVGTAALAAATAAGVSVTTRQSFHCQQNSICFSAAIACKLRGDALIANQAAAAALR